MTPLLLALFGVREMHLDDRPRKDLERVADRVAVVRPRARVHDHPLGPLERVVAEVDVLALAVRLPAARRVADVLRPGIDLLLELAQRETAVERGVSALEDVEVDPVENVDAHPGKPSR